MACLFVEQLTVLDFSRLDQERGLVGESWIVDLELEGELDEQSMVLDFGEVKRRAREAVESYADHRLLVPAASDASVVEKDGRVEVDFPWGIGRRIRVACPACAVTLVGAAAVDMAEMQGPLVAAVRRVVPDTVQKIRLGLREEATPGHYFHYSHGLKRHAGLCQRIAHGHRSRIEITRDGRQDDAQEAAWADRWKDIYLASADDLAESGDGADGDRLAFEYDAAEGKFELSIDAGCCEVVPTDTTVECLAQYVADQLADRFPGQRIVVRLYEGVHKGAIGLSPAR
ncbi:MAG: 6-carboxytetrahydropterin synthase [Gammaproteobacteria bacterium]